MSLRGTNSKRGFKTFTKSSVTVDLQGAWISIEVHRRKEGLQTQNIAVNLGLGYDLGYFCDDTFDDSAFYQSCYVGACPFQD